MPDICDQLRQQCREVWDALFSHPFVLGMADGSLPVRKFAFYVSQNILFLQDLARTTALGAAKATDEMTLREFSLATSRILELEVPQNRALLARVGQLEPSAREAAIMVPTNLAYTRHLLSVGYSSSAAHVAAALLPCTWSYGEIGKALVDRAVEHPVYSEWFHFFSGEPYWVSVRAALAQLRRLADGLGPREAASMTDIFTASARLEYAFWDMAMAEQAWAH